MARRPRRSGHPQIADYDTRARLLEAAKEEFLETGVRAAKIASICRRAELANGTFYIHFKTKDELYLELATMAAMELGKRLRVAHEADLDAKSRDRVEIAIIVDFAEEREDLFKMLSNERSGFSFANQAFFDALNEQRRGALEDGIKKGEFRHELDPMITALADFGITTNIVQWWLVNRDSVPKQFVIDKLADMRGRILFPD